MFFPKEIVFVKLWFSLNRGSFYITMAVPFLYFIYRSIKGNGKLNLSLDIYIVYQIKISLNTYYCIHFLMFLI